jgi:uncharacterized integral membrane protein
MIPSNKFEAFFRLPNILILLANALSGFLLANQLFVKQCFAH